MRKFLKLFIFLFIILILISSVDINANYDSDPTWTGEASYQVIQRKNDNDLGYGINHYTDIAVTTRQLANFSQHVNVLEIPTTSSAKIISYANLSNHRWTLTTLTNIAKQFETENPEWRVIAGVNADFYDIRGEANGLQYQPLNPHVSNGEFYRTTVSHNMVGFTNDGSTNTLISGRDNIRTDYMKLAVYDDNDKIIKVFNIDKLNQAPLENETSIFFGIYSNQTYTYQPKIVESNALKTYFVENSELSLPNNQNDFYGRGVISSLSGTVLQRGQFALATNNQEIIDFLDIGVKIRAQYEFKGEYASINSTSGYSGKFLEAGDYISSSASVLNARHPRTVVGVKNDGTIVMAVIDGRQESKNMDGVFGNEMAAIMKRYGCIEAYNLDGGGSSQMIIRQEGQFVVTNSPSDGRERSISNALLVAVQMPNIEMEIKKSQDSISINTQLLKNNDHDIDELYLEFNNQLIKIENNKDIIIANLISNNEYYYRFLYRDSSGNLNSLLLDGWIKTLKIHPKVLFLEINEVQIFYEFTLHFVDFDNTRAFYNPTLKINDKNFTIWEGSLILFQNQVGTDFKDVFLIYSYSLIDGIDINENIRVSFVISSSVETQMMDSLLQNQNNWMKGIFK